jgi:hypothetical protein
MTTEEFILAAAIKIRVAGTDKIYTMPLPCRHQHIIEFMHAQGVERRLVFTGKQGFITSTGRFLRRSTAWSFAEQSGQIVHRDKMPRGVLYSEHLW